MLKIHYRYVIANPIQALLCHWYFCSSQTLKYLSYAFSKIFCVVPVIRNNNGGKFCNRDHFRKKKHRNMCDGEYLVGACLGLLIIFSSKCSLTCHIWFPLRSWGGLMSGKFGENQRPWDARYFNEPWRNQSSRKVPWRGEISSIKIAFKMFNSSGCHSVSERHHESGFSAVRIRVPLQH